MLAGNPTWSMDNDNIGFINIKQAQWKEPWATGSVDISLNPSPSISSAKFSATFCYKTFVSPFAGGGRRSAGGSGGGGTPDLRGWIVGNSGRQGVRGVSPPTTQRGILLWNSNYLQIDLPIFLHIHLEQWRFTNQKLWRGQLCAREIFSMCDSDLNFMPKTPVENAGHREECASAWRNMSNKNWTQLRRGCAWEKKCDSENVSSTILTTRWGSFSSPFFTHLCHQILRCVYHQIKVIFNNCCCIFSRSKAYILL